MARAGDGMPVVMGGGVDLARQPCPDGDADEQESHDLTSIERDK
jgi:hypothetical protein